MRVCGRCAFALSKTQVPTLNVQLKSQISASAFCHIMVVLKVASFLVVEDVSKALMSENQQLRAIIESNEAIKKEQAKTIEAS